jgi:hypothetical protein
MISGRADFRNRVSVRAISGNSVARHAHSNKNVENNPMHSNRPLAHQGLAHRARWFDSSGKTLAGWHHRSNHQRQTAPSHGRGDAIVRKPLIDIPKITSVRGD